MKTKHNQTKDNKIVTYIPRWKLLFRDFNNFGLLWNEKNKIIISLL